MGYVTPEQITQAKELDLLTYLQRYDLHELVHVSGSTYCTREHDSLKISNGKWNWFSRGIGGKTPWTISLKSRAFRLPRRWKRLLGGRQYCRPFLIPPPNLPHPENFSCQS